MRKTSIAPVVRLTPSAPSVNGTTKGATKNEITLKSQKLLKAYQNNVPSAAKRFEKRHPAALKEGFEATLFDARMVILFEQMSAASLSLDKLKKQAKSLLKAIRNGDELALLRLHRNHPKINAQTKTIDQMVLADCFHILAREHGFDSWPKLKHHIEHLEQLKRARPQLDQVNDAHIRCGNDLKESLAIAGLVGQFIEVSDPFTFGPVFQLNDQKGQEFRAKFLEQAFGSLLTKTELQANRQNMAAEKSFFNNLEHQKGEVVLWFEHDAYDQLCLAYILFQLSNIPMPLPFPCSLVQVDSFPGVERFIGLGNLARAPENIQLLYQQRLSITPDMIAFGARVWNALTASTPLELWKCATEKAAPLPILQNALLRFLAELPSARNGLSMTEELTLQILLEEKQLLARRMFLLLMAEKDPQPYLGDAMYFNIVEKLLNLDNSPLKRVGKLDIPGPGTDILDLTPFGAALLEGKGSLFDGNSFQRWVGGVEINSRLPKNWHFKDNITGPVLT